MIDSPLLIGDSPEMRELRARIERVGPTTHPVLIRGPRGSGKELVAQALHAVSRRTGRFVPFNVCAIPDTMFEDALFGHVVGAFTGAAIASPGFLVEANRGTAFFDEISGISLTNQRKLLRVLETQTFRPVGAAADRHSDFRVVAATNDDLDAMVDAGQFRPDVADRLAGIVIDVPPLRERLTDLPALARHFLAKCDTGGRIELTDSAIGVLLSYDWPGNVRELRHVISRVVALHSDRHIGREDVANALPSTMKTCAAAGRTESMLALSTLLMQLGWDTAKAAEILGVARSTVYRRLARAGISVNARRGRPLTARDPLVPDLDSGSPTGDTR